MSQEWRQIDGKLHSIETRQIIGTLRCEDITTAPFPCTLRLARDGTLPIRLSAALPLNEWMRLERKKLRSLAFEGSEPPDDHITWSTSSMVIAAFPPASGWAYPEFHVNEITETLTLPAHDDENVGVAAGSLVFSPGPLLPGPLDGRYTRLV